MARSYEFYVTAGINAAIEQNIRFAREVFSATTRYTAGDWGDLCESDKELNEQALQRGGRILAAYPTSLGRMYIITDDATAEKLVTTVLFADEY